MRKKNFSKNPKQHKESDNGRHNYQNRIVFIFNNADDPGEKGGYTSDTHAYSW